MFSVNPLSMGTFLGGVQAPVEIATYDLVIYNDDDGDTYLLFDDSLALKIYRTKLNGTLRICS